MAVRVRKQHYHKCYECRGKVVCWVIHNKMKTDIIASRCDGCLRKIVEGMGELNV